MTDSSHKRICCVIPSLRPGGAERVMAYLCNHLAQNGHEVHLITLASADEQVFFALDPGIDIHALALLETAGGVARVRKTLGRITSLRRLIIKLLPDAVITFTETTNITVLMACAASGIPVIACERTDPAAYSKVIGPLRSNLRNLTYPLASAVTVQTKRAGDYFSSRYKDKLHIIPNPIFESDSRAAPDKPGDNGRYRIIALGRLGPEKGYDVLLEAFAQLANEFPLWDVVIFGEGGERARLEADIKRLTLSGRVLLPGLTKDVEHELANSHIMAFPSRFEGFPNALAEGLAAGLPAIAFKHVSGVEELIDPGRTGLLATRPNSIDDFTEHLRTLMGDPARRAELGKNAVQHVKNWSPEKVFSSWEKLLEDVAKAN